MNFINNTLMSVERACDYIPVVVNGHGVED